MKAVCRQEFQSFPHMNFVLHQNVAVNQNVIKVRCQKFIEMLSKDVVDEILPISRNVCEFKEHNQNFVKSSSSSEGCFPHIFIRNSNEIERIANIQFDEIMNFEQSS